MSTRTNFVSVPARRWGGAQRLAMLLLWSGASLTTGCSLTLDGDELDAKAAGIVVVDAGLLPAPSEGFTTSLDTPPIELADGTTTRDPCVATTQQVREILTTDCSECHAPPGAAAGFSSVLDFPTLITLRSATARDPDTQDLVRLVIPGQPEKSRLYLRARNGEMPPTRPPSERQLARPTISDISVLRTWIQSCLANYGSDTVSPPGAATPGAAAPGAATPGAQ
jgi:mono/diheme cytochrome c family protein